ncbi:3' terminal RNA ribose 2'-O-methyltransferase Hen1 [cf. Phormidesmis sp. LEGE 11477]|uniref:3' terminal RNA ribose 2'-O-methyltransferase Hen1 n=1 Tax=cf. Phormidesmis sp. LEGE 11477 TaxID=1828680 RepID=UPI001881FED1|nr:3' terminal RNA ribose 2'-O-methyltransferase Hen1 [cf. Phormidesmis sp. LEGE 11477]MBE9064903.1 3' terminal RNA ribose 2'-O-methyltransferase Hen1 [cf. Phormidesmis sp. LEGE 11477]
MLLTLSTTHQPATDLGYLLHKHPERTQTFALGFGQAHVFYPEARAERCTAALLLEIDPVGLVRKSARQGGAFDQYVNDRPYVASSFLSVAIAKVFSTALSGRCKDRPDLVNTPIPLTITLPVLPCRGGETFLRDLFEPLGYAIAAEPLPLDETFPDWGNSRYLSVTLSHKVRLSDLLSHLYVLIPVMDEDKHYWFGADEVDKLLRHGEGWLKDHPHREQITQRYFKRVRKLAEVAIAQLMEGEDPDADAELAAKSWQKLAAKKPVSLNQQRMAAVAAVLKSHHAKRVVDLGCGEGNLLKALWEDRFFERLMGIDVSFRALETAKKRLRVEQIPLHQRERLQLMQGSLTYRDERLIGYDAAAVIEVIEHMDLNRLATFEQVLFQFAQPPLVVITTPNAEFNALFPTLEKGHFRHQDHRFEWTRPEFQAWADSLCKRYGYQVEFQGIGFESPEVGTPSQMGVFVRQEERQ